MFTKIPAKQLLWSTAIYKACSSNWLAMRTPSIIGLAEKLCLGRPVHWFIRNSIFAKFCGGETIEDARSAIRELRAHDLEVILDYAAEPDLSPNRCSISSESNALEAFYEGVLGNILQSIDSAAGSPDAIVAVKLSGLFDHQFLENTFTSWRPTSEDCGLILQSSGWRRLDSICKHAIEKKVHIAIDAEQSFVQDAIDSIGLCAMERFNSIGAAKTPLILNTYQMYRTDGLDRMRQHFAFSEERKFHFGAKIVRGAYVVGERIWAAEKSTECPIFSTAAQTHEQYDSSIALVFEYISQLASDEPRRFIFVFATHNEESLALAARLYRDHNMYANPKARVAFAQLFGMSDAASRTLAEAGYPVYKYLPYGPVRAVVPYLIRRSQENTSIFARANSDASLMWGELKSRFWGAR